MTLSDSFRFAIGKPISGGNVILEVSDNVRHCMATMYDNGELVIGFDCTLGSIWPPETDWFQNLMAWPMTFSVGSSKYKAMAGFVGEYLSIRESIFNAIDTEKPKTIRIFGYSQGAAHATLAWRDLANRYPTLGIHATVFASPRVYATDSAREFDLFLSNSDPKVRTFQRYECWGDPVPHLPPLILGYSPVGPVKMIGPFRFIFNPSVHEGSNYIKVLESL